MCVYSYSTTSNAGCIRADCAAAICVDDRTRLATTRTPEHTLRVVLTGLIMSEHDNRRTAAVSTRLMTSSSAVAKRSRDVSCLSVVSCNNTKRRVESFIASYVRYRFVTACS